MGFQLVSLIPQEIMPHLVPYAIIVINCVLFRLLRLFINELLARYLIKPGHYYKNKSLTGKTKLIKLFIDELVSTCELCADCAELNVVYEKHGSLAYGFSLFILSYLWIDSFGDAYTTPGYLAEDYFLIKGNELLKTGDAYARFIGQSLAMPLAWRLANIYWKYQLIKEHSQLLIIENCKSSLTTSTLNGFLIEFICCLICRLAELIGHKLLERNSSSQRMVSLVCSFLCSILVVFALELSGGYFNPVLAASLEYGCKGIHVYQHVLVFWLGPLLGHVVARALFRRCSERLVAPARQWHKTTRHQSNWSGQRMQSNNGQEYGKHQQQQSRRQTRSSSQRKRHSLDKVD